MHSSRKVRKMSVTLLVMLCIVGFELCGCGSTQGEGSDTSKTVPDAEIVFSEENESVFVHEENGSAAVTVEDHRFNHEEDLNEVCVSVELDCTEYAPDFVEKVSSRWLQFYEQEPSFDGETVYESEYINIEGTDYWYCIVSSADGQMTVRTWVEQEGFLIDTVLDDSLQ